MAVERVGAALADLVARRDLDRDTARALMDALMDGTATPVRVAAVLVALRVKGETADEIAGMAESMRERAVRVELDVDAVDTCGTGGDGCGTFNISTAAALVVAGAGCHVAKHGNRAASSQCGSADVLEALGVDIDLGPEQVARCVREARIGFMFAPRFHPAMRAAAPVRQELGVRTVFNVLGPLANPARVRRQAVGVADPTLAPVMAHALHRMGHERALVFHGNDGIDELSLSGASTVHDVSPAGVRSYSVDPEELGLERAPVSALRGGDAAHNAAVVRAVLDGQPRAARDAVLLNAGAALVAAGAANDMSAAVARARTSIDSGSAREALEALVRVSSGRG